MNKILTSILNLVRKFGTTIRDSWKEIISSIRGFSNAKNLTILFGLTILAILFRVFLIQRPMQHDEAYTAVVFGFRPFIKIITDYHFPNNHVFHSILVHISYLLFGPNEWGVRSPAFAASVLSAPFGFILARRWYGNRIALISGISIAVFPSMIHYAVNARGYAVMALFTLMIFIMGDFVKRHNNILIWGSISICGALGFLTLPIMAYPLAIFYVWMGFVWLKNQFGQRYTRRSFLAFMLGSGLLTIIFSLLLYTPIFLNWGVKSVFSNPYVSALDQSLYLQTLGSRLSELWAVLNFSAIPGFGFILIIGFLLSILFHKSTSDEKVSLSLLSILVIIALVAFQRPNIYARTWVFYYPLLLIWVTAGWVGFFHFITRNQKKYQNTTKKVLIASFLAILLINGFYYVATELRTSKRHSGDVEQTTLFLKSHLTSEDIVIITATDDAAMWFYFEKYALGQDFFLKDRPFESAYVVVTFTKDQTVEQVIQERGPDMQFFNFQTTEKIGTIGQLDIYKIRSNGF